MGSHRVAALALFLVVVPSAPAFAEEPLPLVRPLASPAPFVALAVEPVRDAVDFVPVAYTETIATPARALEALRTAIVANDFAGFRSALTQASSLADSMPLGDGRNALRRNLLIYRDVEQLWTFARNDRFGAFFDDESLPGFRDHLSADYRGIDSFLAANRIVDRNGLELYPTAETRTYLLNLVDSTPTREKNRTLVASAKPRSAKSAKKTVHRVAHHTAPHALPTRAVVKATSIAAATTAPVVIVPAAPVAAPQSDAFAMPEQVAVLPKRTTDAVQAAPVATAQQSSTAHGIFFIILALVLLGGLVTMLRTPQAPTVMPAPDELKPKSRRDDDVIPMKKAQ